jgi:hypothetical protein
MKLSAVIKMEIANCNLTNPSKIRKYLIDKIGTEVPIGEIENILELRKKSN